MYLGFLLITVVICIAFDVVSYYTVHCQGKRYDFLKGAKDAVEGFVMISFTWWILARFFDGFDSKFGIWLLAGFFGLMLAALIGTAVESVCKKIWPDSTEIVEPVRMSKGLQIALAVFTFVVFLCFAGFVGYGIFFTDTFNGVWENVMAVLGLLISAFGVHNSISKIVRLIRK